MLELRPFEDQHHRGPPSRPVISLSPNSIPLTTTATVKAGEGRFLGAGGVKDFDHPDLWAPKTCAYSFHKPMLYRFSQLDNASLASETRLLLSFD